MNFSFLLLYAALSHYYYSDDNIDIALHNTLHPEQQIALKPPAQKDKNIAIAETAEPELASEPLLKEELLSDEVLNENIAIAETAAPELASEPLLKEENTIDDNIPEAITINTESNIKAESNLEDLDETEFSFDDIKIDDEGDQIEITNNKEVIDQKLVDNESETSKITKPQNQTPVFVKKKIYDYVAYPSLTEAKEAIKLYRLNTILLSIIPIEKLDKNYNIIVNPKIINQRAYPAPNQHLDTVFFHEEYFQMLYAAIDNNNINMINAVTARIGFNNEIYARNEPPFLYAINKGDINVIRKMLALGYNPDIQNSRGDAAIHIAILKNRVDIITELIKAKANLLLANNNYKRPMALALEQKNYYIADLLVKAGVKEMNSHESFTTYIESGG